VPANFRALLEVLEREQVRYVVIGGLAAVTHGVPAYTDDFDICYDRRRDNLPPLVRAIAPLHPMLRTRDGALPFVWDERTVQNGLNFTLITDLGDLDILGEVSGVGGYDPIASEAEIFELYGYSVRIMSIPQLIASKKAAGRAKDLDHIDALEEVVRQRKKA
jgi:hypothetical protein